MAKKTEKKFLSEWSKFMHEAEAALGIGKKPITESDVYDDMMNVVHDMSAQGMSKEAIVSELEGLIDYVKKMDFDDED